MAVAVFSAVAMFSAVAVGTVPRAVTVLMGAVLMPTVCVLTPTATAASCTLFFGQTTGHACTVSCVPPRVPITPKSWVHFYVLLTAGALAPGGT
jgi:predicted acyltransferase